MTKHGDEYKHGDKVTALRFQTSKQKKFGNAIRECCVAEAKCGPLKPWERWKSRKPVFDRAYREWGRK